MTPTQIPLTPHVPATVIRQRRIADMYAAAVARLNAVDRMDAHAYVRICRWCDVLYRALCQADMDVGQDGPPLTPERAYYRFDRQERRTA